MLGLIKRKEFDLYSNAYGFNNVIKLYYSLMVNEFLNKEGNYLYHIPIHLILYITSEKILVWIKPSQQV